MKKLLCLTLTALTVLLSSCGVIIINNAGSDTTVPEETEPNNYDKIVTASPEPNTDDGYNGAMETLNSLTTKTADGGTFFIACTESTFFNGNGEETSLNTDRITRIKLLETKLGCKFYTKTADAETIVSEVAKSVKSGEAFSDVLAIPAGSMGSLISNSLLTPLQTVPGMDLSADHFDSDSKDAFTLNGNVYGITGDGLFTPETLPCIIYSDEPAKANVAQNIPELVKNGQWTIDKLNEILASVNADGITRFSAPENSEEALLLGSGVNYTANNSGTLSLNTFTDSFSMTAGKLANLFSVASAPTEFSDNKTLFSLTTLSQLEKYKDLPFVWSIAPLPKASADSEYVSPMSADTTVMCIPISAYDTEYAGDFIEAFNAASKDYMVNRYISHCANRVLRNEASVYSLCQILGKNNYDISLALRGEYVTLSEYTVNVYKKMLAGSITADELSSLKTEAEEYMQKHFSPAPTEE